MMVHKVSDIFYELYTSCSECPWEATPSELEDRNNIYCFKNGKDIPDVNIIPEHCELITATEAEIKAYQEWDWQVGQ